MIQKVTISLPKATLQRLDKAVPSYKRSQALHIAVELLLAVKDYERDEWRAAFRALCRG